ncbi:MAG: membrane dipeptidase [Bacteroidota bacterium]|nr:membrane dipeptidase [Candidatus Kapabacteria bacterium]MDW8272380.1 membrane dipeptidase [Bacteroidota bacterium]
MNQYVILFLALLIGAHALYAQERIRVDQRTRRSVQQQTTPQRQAQQQIEQQARQQRQQAEYFRQIGQLSAVHLYDSSVTSIGGDVGGFWVANLDADLGQRLRAECTVSADPRYQWQIRFYADSTCSIHSIANPDMQVVYFYLQASELLERARRGGGGGMGRRTHEGYNGLTLLRGGEIREYRAGSSPEHRAGLVDTVVIIDRFPYRWQQPRTLWIRYERQGGLLPTTISLRLIYPSEIPSSRVNLTFSNLDGWRAFGDAFRSQPCRRNRFAMYGTPLVPYDSSRNRDGTMSYFPRMPLGGLYWQRFESLFSITTRTSVPYIHTGRPQNPSFYSRPELLRPQGVLLSDPVFCCNPTIEFRIGGTRNDSAIRFEIWVHTDTAALCGLHGDDGHYRLVRAFTGHNNEITRLIRYRDSSLLGKRVRFRIVDNDPNGYIVVDAIRFSNQLPLEEEPPVFPSTERKPIFGTIDMHTHPMSYLGMGGKMMYGKLDGDPRRELNNCNSIHGGWGLDNPTGNYLRAIMINLIDEHHKCKQERALPVPDLLQFLVGGFLRHTDHKHEGYPRMECWPSQHSITHQQMWYEWLRRAREGGLSAIVALTVNAELLGLALDGHPPYDDKTVADLQIDELIAFVHRHRDFLDTVTTPERMREVINSGKMAVIIGMEIDNIGNFYKNANVSFEDIRREIQRLKDKGVRYIFPIHITDNKFGGAAAYKGLFNLSNKFATGHPFSAAWFGMPPVFPEPPPPDRLQALVSAGRFMDVETAPDPRVRFRYSRSLPLLATPFIQAFVQFAEMGGLPPPPPCPVPDPFYCTAWGIATAQYMSVKVAVDLMLQVARRTRQYQLIKHFFLHPHPEAELYDRIPGGHRNRLGLTEHGRFAIREMMRQGMIIDIDHCSEKAADEILQIAEEFDYPVVSGHNHIRGTDPHLEVENEKSRTEAQTEKMRRLGGMFGIGWENLTPQEFARKYQVHLDAMGGTNVAFGSDIDGYAYTVKAGRCPRRDTTFEVLVPQPLVPCRMGGQEWNFEREGMAHIGLYPDFFEAVEPCMSDNELRQFFLASENFARMWEKCIRQSARVPRE